MARLQVQISPDETRRFGVRAARAVGVTSPDFPEVLEFCRNEGVVLLTMRCDVKDVDVVHVASASGFLLMDTLVYTAAVPAEVAAPKPKLPAEFRFATTADVVAVSDLSAAAFANYVGHFHADQRFARADATAVYIDWAGRLCRDAATENPVILAEVEGRLAGFAGIRKSGIGADCELCAVAPFARGLGVFKALLAQFAAWACTSGIEEIYYSTPLQNTVVLASLTKQGFYYVRAQHTFHKWFSA